jgi:hypothetical protein
MTISYVLGSIGLSWDVEAERPVSTCGVAEWPQPMEEPMKYLILIYHNPQSREIWEGFSDAERAEGLAAYAALNESLAASGELVVAEALEDPSMAKTVTVRDGQTMASDGPFAEAKEHLAGFYLVECETVERAVEIAAQIPEADMGLLEVRPILTYSGLEM